MIDYIKSAKRPFKNPKALVLGIILNIPIPFLKIITNTIATGYILECCKTSYNRETKLPTWKNYVDLWIKGIHSYIIKLIYTTPLILLTYSYSKELIKEIMRDKAITINAITNPSNIIEIYSEITLHIVELYGESIIVLYIISILTEYITTMAIISYIIKNRFLEAFEIKNIVRKVIKPQYILAWTTLKIISTTIIIATIPIYIAALSKVWTPNTIVAITIISALTYIVNIFQYTVYGNVIKEITN